MTISLSRALLEIFEKFQKRLLRPINGPCALLWTPPQDRFAGVSWDTAWDTCLQKIVCTSSDRGIVDVDYATIKLHRIVTEATRRNRVRNGCVACALCAQAYEAIVEEKAKSVVYLRLSSRCVADLGLVNGDKLAVTVRTSSLIRLATYATIFFHQRHRVAVLWIFSNCVFMRRLHDAIGLNKLWLEPLYTSSNRLGP